MLSVYSKSPIIKRWSFGVNFLDLSGFHRYPNALGQKARVTKCRQPGQCATSPGKLLLLISAGINSKSLLRSMVCILGVLVFCFVSDLTLYVSAALDTGLHWPVAVFKLSDMFPCQGFCTCCSLFPQCSSFSCVYVSFLIQVPPQISPRQKLFVLIIFSKYAPTRIYFFSLIFPLSKHYEFIALLLSSPPPIQC